MSAPTRRARRARPRAQRPTVEPASPTPRPKAPEPKAKRPAPAPPTDLAPVLRTSDALRVAEESLVVLEAGYADAHQLWTDAIRRSGHGLVDERSVQAAQDGLDRAEAQLDRVRIDVERLRRRLYEERQRELLLEAVSRQEVAHHESARRSIKPARRRSLLDRLLRRR